MSLTYGPSIVMNGLVFYVDAANTRSYPGSGTAWRDLSGNGNTGTLTNGPTFSSANGGVITFDGTDDFIDTSNNVGLLPTAGLTITCWIKTSVADKFLVDKANTALTSGYLLAGTGSGTCVFYINSINVASSATINSNTWKQITAVWVPSTALRIYINGDLDNSNITSVPASITDPSVNLWIGRRRTVADYWNGNISSVSIYNLAFNADQIRQNFNALRGRYGI